MKRFHVGMLMTLAFALLSSPLVSDRAADPYTPPYPSVTPGDLEIHYDDGQIGGLGLTIDSEGATIRVLFTPSADGLLHEIRMAWSNYGWQNAGNFRLVIEDADTGTSVTSLDTEALMSYSVSDPPVWQVVDVLSLGFVTSGDFYVYICYVDGGFYYSPAQKYLLGIMHDYAYADGGPVEHLGRFQYSPDPSTDPWESRGDLLVRATITTLPDHVIPEMPFGTATALILSLAALVLARKRL